MEKTGGANFENKSSVEEIRRRFDADVERFSNLETGQASAVDAALCLELITEAAARLRPGARDMLDVGCGAGNYTLKMLSKLSGLNCTLLDLSAPMLERAAQRVGAASSGALKTVQADIREAELAPEGYDIILSGAALHHLRGDEEWEGVFSKLSRLLRPGGCLMVSDLVAQETRPLGAYMRELYGAYLSDVGGPEYSDGVLAYVDAEDSPRSLNYQLGLLEKSGFSKIEVLHKRLCFAAYGAVK